ncbi:LolA family protein [Microbacterium hominis]|uniref:DUF2092 domain-containing protein n=1 Tax=Microbacterium hominis TaxID=162426 RepID=A0A7D4UIX2_9MICO|nr:hypothetical protein [Microbacterium hominis]QKJ20388.1 hypothetical protein HQM25_14135 [Microbacterium hominis]
MSRHRRPLDRPALWGAAVAVPAVVAAAIFVPIAASGAVDLPDKTVEELIAFAHESDVDALSGTIEQTSELGLPDLDALTGALGNAGDARGDGPSEADLDDLVALLTGSHTAKVYLDGEQARLQVLDQLGERNVYVDGAAEQVWYVDSETQTATRVTHTPGDSPTEPRAQDALPTPDAMLDEALARLDETTEVSVGTDSRVAGRDVYELIMVPRTADTLVGEVRFAIDGETGAALAASITARGAGEPAFEIAFTQVDFAAPDPAVFAFEPSDAMTVAEKEIAGHDRGDGEHPERGTGEDAAPAVYGEGWSTVVEIAAPEAGGDAAPAPDQQAMLESLTTPVEGGRAIETALVSVLLTDDGRVLVGAVPASRLVDAAQTGR